MGGKRIIAITILIFLSLWGAVYLETSMKSNFFAELFIVAVMVIGGFGIVLSISEGMEIGLHGALVFFAAAMLNTIFLYYASQSLLPSMLTMLVNMAGFTVSFSMMKKEIGIIEQEISFEKPVIQNDEIKVEPVKDFTNFKIYDVKSEFYEAKPKKKTKSKKRK